MGKLKHALLQSLVHKLLLHVKKVSEVLEVDIESSMRKSMDEVMEHAGPSLYSAGHCTHRLEL